MKILRRNLKNNILKLKVEDFDDVWILSQTIEPGDSVRGKTERKLKLGEDTDRNARVVRKTMTLTIKVEKVELSEDSEKLRVLGPVSAGPEEVPQGEYHSFNIKEDSIISIQKKWLKFQLDKIQEATKSPSLKAIAVIFDREEAYFVELSGRGHKILGKLSGDVQKKEELHVSSGNFYEEIKKRLVEYDKHKGVQSIVVASPAFWKEELMKKLPEEIKKKTIQASVSQVSNSAVNELMKRPELKKIMTRSRSAEEIKSVDKLLKNISDDKACYGFEETKKKVMIGAVKELVVSHNFIKKMRTKERYHEVERLLQQAEEMDGEVHIISSEKAQKSLDSLAGVAGILRWKDS